MFGWFSNKTKESAIPLFFHNTLGNRREQFMARGGAVRMYNCGPTVYDFQHIGNLSAAVFADTIRRVLEYNSYAVKQVVNITDFGHLTSDADEGEDKMMKGLMREGLAPTIENMKLLADKYTNAYLEDIKKLGVDTEKIEFPRASEYISSQIALIKTLDEKGYAYRTKDGIYFDTALFKNYGALGGIVAGNQEGARVAAHPEKHNPADFALWKFSKNEVGWDSPWGQGTPGWHIECSAMTRSLLGEQIDIHTGGIEHISIHHNNEIAQSEAATGKSPFSRFWLHRAHIQLEGHKIAKSEGEVVYLKDVIEHGFSPLALRYWFLTSHYKTPANFTWEALEGAQNALKRLERALEGVEMGTIPTAWQKKFHECVNDDLDTPGAIAVMWDMFKDEKLQLEDKKAALMDFDRMLGIGLSSHKTEPPTPLPPDVQKLVDEREEARKKEDWSRADELREEIKKKGFLIEDVKSGPRVTQIFP